MTTQTMECPRCHGAGTIAREVTARQQAVLDKLAEAGERRAGANRHTVDGRKALDKAFEDIRKLSVRATAVGLTREQVAAAVGVARAQLHNILTHNPTGRAKVAK